ncbi:MAG TPA: hypothetical protein VIM91_07245 [Thiomicrospira sp.]
MEQAVFNKPVKWRDTLTRLLWVNLIFLMLAMIANALLERWSLFSAHALTFLALSVILFSTYRFKVEPIQQAYLAVMWCYFFQLFLGG